MNRAKPDTIAWQKSGRSGGRPSYQNVFTGERISYDGNRWMWIVESTGHAFKGLTYAQYDADSSVR